MLCNLLHKPAGLLFGELLQAVSEFHIGDVQYHQGQASTLAFPNQVHIFPLQMIDPELIPPDSLKAGMNAAPSDVLSGLQATFLGLNLAL